MELSKDIIGQTIEPPNVCPTCYGGHIVHDHITGEDICQDCGLVVSSYVINNGREWSAFTVKEHHNRERVGPSIIGKDGTTYTHFNLFSDGQGRPLSTSTQKRMKRLWRQNIGALDPEMRNLTIAQNLIKKIVEKMRLGSNSYNYAYTIYKRAFSRGFIKGKSIECFAAASVLSVLREMNLPRSIEEVAQQASVELLMLSKYYRALISGLGLKLPIDDPSKYVGRISTALGLSHHVESDALEIIKLAMSKRLMQGKRPKTIAAAALYISAKIHREDRTQEIVALSSNVSEITLRKRIKELKTFRCMIASPNEWVRAPSNRAPIPRPDSARFYHRLYRVNRS